MGNETIELRFDANSMVAVLLAIVFVAAAFQTTQLAGISGKLAQQEAAIAGLKAGGGVLATQGSALAQASPQGEAGLPQSLQNLPSQVGGC
ncbi:MAG: hypothetical protein AABW85_02520 [archaeon]